jgi:hypothetical protein
LLGVHITLILEFTLELNCLLLKYMVRKVNLWPPLPLPSTQINGTHMPLNFCCCCGGGGRFSVSEFEEARESIEYSLVRSREDGVDYMEVN